MLKRFAVGAVLGALVVSLNVIGTGLKAPHITGQATGVEAGQCDEVTPDPLTGKRMVYCCLDEAFAMQEAGLLEELEEFLKVLVSTQDMETQNAETVFLTPYDSTLHRKYNWTTFCGQKIECENCEWGFLDRFQCNRWTAQSVLPRDIVEDFSVLSYQDRLWVIGVTDILVSSDGAKWEKVGSLPEHMPNHASAVHDNGIWVTGNKSVLFSQDGTSWTTLGALPHPLSGHTLLSYAGALWIIGGYNSDTLQVSQKVYRSLDGRNWTEVGFNALPKPLSNHTAEVYAGKMWVLLGGSPNPSGTIYSSSDGETWTKEGEHIPLRDHASLVYDNLLFILGGRGTSQTNTVYYSGNGKEWQSIESALLPSAIDQHEAIAFQDQLWVIGGNRNEEASDKIEALSCSITENGGGLCGDGLLSAAEQCDNGNGNSDTEPGACRTDCTLPVCGDFILDFSLGEECDDGAGNANEADACRTTCTLPRCGDAIRDDKEECDDGNTTNGDGCSSTCTSEFVVSICGNGIVDEGEECDDANTDDSDGCTVSCTLEPFIHGNLCGNSLLETGEECDDGNTASRDGCSAECNHEQPASSSASSERIAEAPSAPEQPDQMATVGPLPAPTPPSADELESQRRQVQASILQRIQAEPNARTTATGPAIIAIMAGGAAAGIARMRRRKKK